MASYKDLVAKVKELSALTGKKTKPAIPDRELADSVAALDGVLRKIEGYFPPSPQMKKEAKAHPLRAQILSFTTMDAQRKKFFSADYFKRKFLSLPEDRKTVASTVPTTVAGLRDAIVLYYYWSGDHKGERSLEGFWREVEQDFKNSPAARQSTEAKKTLEDLLSEKSVAAIAAKLEAKYPKSDDLKQFAKLTRLTIPAQSRAKGAPKKTVHERLAERIFSQGGVVRVSLD